MSARPLRLGLLGYGRMGRALEAAASRQGHTVVARITRDPTASSPQVVAQLDPDAVDVVLEFTQAAAAPGLIRGVLERGIPVVAGSTGWDDGVHALASLANTREVPFLWAPNFALGVQVLLRLTELTARALGRAGGFAPYLVEEHHAAKRDAPSGTARQLASRVVAATPGKERYGAVPADGPVPPELVPVAWIRAGAIPGTHRVGWDAASETLELVHCARDRAVFADGALRAAEWLVGRPGAHTLDELIDELVQPER